ncbi:MAG: STAS domain-containing protein [Chitinispirillaceae bacterium]|nr:STAS domain-containing protein [Chitinispirillaceae bacterium]
MQIERIEKDNELLFKVTGSLSGMPDSAPKFFNQVSSELQSSRKNLALDFSKLMFLDSMAIGLLVGIIIKAKNLNCTVHILNAQPLIRDILEATQLKKLYPDLY